jgi:type VI secretion system protein VasJ
MLTIVKEISSKNPTGDDWKYEDGYLAIEAEIDKTMSASNVGDVDWKFIYEEATNILQNESKDLKIASYWLYAKWKLNSWDGLEAVLPLYIELISTYQERLFPKSIKVKLRILEWLNESLTLAFFKNIDTLDENKFKNLMDSLELLESTIVSVFKKEDLKLFSPLIRKLKKNNEEKKNLEKLNKEAEPTEEIEKSSMDEETNVKLEGSNYTLLEHKQELQAKLASITNHPYLFNITQELGFSLFHEAFLEEKNVQREEFPSDEELDYLEKIKDKEHYPEELKVYIVKYPCWLEGQYLLIEYSEKKESMEQYKIISNTLKYKLINFIKENGEKIHIYAPLNYKIVGEALKKWINLEKKYLTISNSNNYEEVFQEAVKISKKKSKEEGILLIETIKKESKTYEESFLWTLKQIYYAFEIDNKNMAIALLYELNQEIEHFNLESWNPHLAIEVYVLFLKPNIIKILNTEKKELIYRKLCKLSPKEAMKISFL